MAVGFAGVLLVIRPGTDFLHWASLLAWGAGWLRIYSADAMIAASIARDLRIYSRSSVLRHVLVLVHWITPPACATCPCSAVWACWAAWATISWRAHLLCAGNIVAPFQYTSPGLGGGGLLFSAIPVSGLGRRRDLVGGGLYSAGRRHESEAGRIAKRICRKSEGQMGPHHDQLSGMAISNIS